MHNVTKADIKKIVKKKMKKLNRAHLSPLERDSVARFSTTFLHKTTSSGSNRDNHENDFDFLSIFAELFKFEIDSFFNKLNLITTILYLHHTKDIMQNVSARSLLFETRELNTVKIGLRGPEVGIKEILAPFLLLRRYSTLSL